MAGRYPCSEKCFYCTRREENEKKYKRHPIFHEGQAVWVRSAGKTLWPAQVVNPYTLRNKDGSKGTTVPTTLMVTVLYFEGIEEPHHENVTIGKIEKVVPGFRNVWDRYSTKSHSPGFQMALDEAKVFYFEDKRIQELDPEAKDGDTAQPGPSTTRKIEPPKSKRGRKGGSKKTPIVLDADDRASPEMGASVPVEAAQSDEEGRKRNENVDVEMAAEEAAPDPAPLPVESEASAHSSTPQPQVEVVKNRKANGKTGAGRRGRKRNKKDEVPEPEPMVEEESEANVVDDPQTDEHRPLSYQESLEHLNKHKIIREELLQKDEKIAKLRQQLEKEREEVRALKREYEEKLPIYEECKRLKKERICGPQEYTVSQEQFGLIADGLPCVHIVKHLRAVEDKMKRGPRRGMLVYHAAQGDENDVKKEREQLSQYARLVDSPRQLMEMCDIVLYMGDVEHEQLYTKILLDSETGLMAGVRSSAADRNIKPGLVIMRNLGVDMLAKIERMELIRSDECLFLFAAAVGVDGWAEEGIYHYVAAGDKSLHNRCKMLYDYTGRGSERTTFLTDVRTCSLFVQALDRIKHGALLSSGQMMDMIKKMAPQILNNKESRATIMEWMRQIGANLASDVVRNAIPAMDMEGQGLPGEALHSFKHVTRDLQMEISHASALQADTATTAVLQQLLLNGKQKCGENEDCSKVVLATGLYKKHI